MGYLSVKEIISLLIEVNLIRVLLLICYFKNLYCSPYCYVRLFLLCVLVVWLKGKGEVTGMSGDWEHADAIFFNLCVSRFSSLSSLSKRGSQSQTSKGVDFESDEVWYIVLFFSFILCQFVSFYSSLFYRCLSKAFQSEIEFILFSPTGLDYCNQLWLDYLHNYQKQG